MSLTRRQLLGNTAAGLLGGVVGVARRGHAQAGATRAVSRVETDTLTIGFEETGGPSGFPILLLHGFPDDVRAWDGVIPALVGAGHRVIAPYLRGHGLTRLRPTGTPRMGEQAALAQDLLDLVDALKLDRCVVCGYDWGGRAAGIVAALHPERVRAAVLIGGYTIQDTFAPPQPASPERERALWYQWYFNTERGRLGLEKNRRSLCRLLWETWSPTWRVTEEVFDRTAPSFDNPDFVDVAIHSYRHRNGNAQGDPRFEQMERVLAKRPRVQAPTITLYGADDGVAGRPSSDSAGDRANFAQLVDRRIVAGVGHFMPRERPEEVSSAILRVLRESK